MKIEGVENITIIGCRNPVLNCNDVGAINFISCKNVRIEGIQWEGCGSMDFPGIEFYNSSDASFDRCTFHVFRGTSTPFSEVSEDVHVSSCNFTPTNEYTGHGAAMSQILAVMTN